MKLQPTILLVEDNHDHLRITRRILERSGLSGTIVVAHDGREALTKLSTGKAPDLVLLDLNMPKIGGLDVLKAIKADPSLSTVPVVVVSSSSRSEDTVRATELGAAGYISKGDGYLQLSRALTSLKKFLPGGDSTNGKA